MDTDDMEPLNEENTPGASGRKSKRNGGTLSPQSNPPINALPTGLNRMREDSSQQETDGSGADNLPL